MFIVIVIVILMQMLIAILQMQMMIVMMMMMIMMMMMMQMEQWHRQHATALQNRTSWPQSPCRPVPNTQGVQVFFFLLKAI